MNYRLLSKVIGLLLLLESIAMGACALFAYFDPVTERGSGVFPLATGAGVLLVVAVGLVLFGLGRYERIPRREGVVIVGLGWILCALFGAIPFVIGEPRLRVEAAIFEAVSGFTTTGSTVIEKLESWPRGILLWRAVMQWLGGLGILVLFVALLSAAGGGAKSLFRNESSFRTDESSKARIRDTALILWKVYVVLTVVCLLGLRVLGLSWFDSTAHALTCPATGGFSPHDDSIGHYSDWDRGIWIELWLMVFMLLGSVSFLIYVVLMRRDWGRLRRQEEAKWYFCGMLVAILAVWAVVMLVGDEKSGGDLRGTVFTVVSLMSTTGYATVDYGKWPVAAHFLLLCLMMIGGCAGSTSGGMKVSRLILLVRAAYHEIVRAFRPNQVFRVQVNGNPIDETARAQTVLFAALFALIALFAMGMVGILEASRDADFETILAATLATFANIGPGFGEVGPASNYANLRPPTHLFLSLLMVLGRLELYAVLVLFVPAAWRRY